MFYVRLLHGVKQDPSKHKSTKVYTNLYLDFANIDVLFTPIDGIVRLYYAVLCCNWLEIRNPYLYGNACYWIIDTILNA